MSDDFAESLDNYTLPQNTSGDVEMLSVQDIKEQGSETGEPEMEDLFGNDDEDPGRLSRAGPASPTSGHESERVPSPEGERPHPLEYGEGDLPPEIAVEVKEAQVKFPNLPVPKSSDGNSWVIRLPNFVSVDTKPFHQDTYIGPEQEDEDLQGDNIRERSMTIKLKVENTLRWRWAKDQTGEDKRESNARIVRWSDGTLSLRLGKEFFDITQSIDSSGRVSRSTLGGSQSQQSQNSQGTGPSGKSEGLTYLVAQHKRSQVLQAEALVTGYMALRPTGMQSEIHRLLVKAVGQKHTKIARLRMAPEPTVDPEREKLELIKQNAKKSKSKRTTHDEFAYGKRKKRTPRSVDRGDIYTDDEDEPGMYAGDEQDEDERRASPRKGKRKPTGDTAEDYQADDFVVPDESDNEGAGGVGSNKKEREASPEQDDLERMEAKLEKQAVADKKSRGGDSQKAKTKAGNEGTDDEDGAMDVESEEEEFKVRRITGKRTVAPEDEDE